MKVAHFVQRYPPALGGSESYFARLSRYLAAAGDQVTVFTTTALDLEAFWRWRARCLPAGTRWEDGVEVRRYGLLRWPGRRWFLKPLSLIPHRPWQCLTLPCNPISWRMWTDAGHANERFDVVHAAAFPYAWPIACGLRLARRLGVPFFVTPFLHLGDPEDSADPTRHAYTAPAFLHLLRAADRVFVQTDVEYEVLIEHGLSSERLILQGLGVEAAECTGGDRAKSREAWRVGPNEVVVGHLANLSAEKGTNDLLLAARRLWETGSRFKVVVAGPAMPNFRRFWKSYPFASRVRCLGVLSDQQKRDFYAGIDLFALPSRSDSFGLVLLEAWANGVPNLAYRAGGIAGVIRHGEDGLMVPCGDIVRLTDALERLITDGVIRRHLGSAGQARLAHDYCWEDSLAKVRSAYEQALAGERGGVSPPWSIDLTSKIPAPS